MDADNTELTSTMGNIMSAHTSKEKNDSSDSTPTSSTDAFNSTKSQLQVTDDPISSTSSDMDPMRPSIISDTDLLDINLTTNPNEKITENVEDIVQDLENLLGEPTTSYFNSAKSRQTDKKGDALLDKMISLDDDEFNSEFNLTDVSIKTVKCNEIVVQEEKEEKIQEKYEIPDKDQHVTQSPEEEKEEKQVQNIEGKENIEEKEAVSETLVSGEIQEKNTLGETEEHEENHCKEENVKEMVETIEVQEVVENKVEVPQETVSGNDIISKSIVQEELQKATDQEVNESLGIENKSNDQINEPEPKDNENVEDKNTDESNKIDVTTKNEEGEVSEKQQEEIEANREETVDDITTENNQNKQNAETTSKNVIDTEEVVKDLIENNTVKNTTEIVEEMDEKSTEDNKVEDQAKECLNSQIPASSPSDNNQNEERVEEQSSLQKSLVADESLNEPAQQMEIEENEGNETTEKESPEVTAEVEKTNRDEIVFSEIKCQEEQMEQNQEDVKNITTEYENKNTTTEVKDTEEIIKHKLEAIETVLSVKETKISIENRDSREEEKDAEHPVKEQEINECPLILPEQHRVKDKPLENKEEEEEEDALPLVHDTVIEPIEDLIKSEVESMEPVDPITETSVEEILQEPLITETADVVEGEDNLETLLAVASLQPDVVDDDLIGSSESNVNKLSNTEDIEVSKNETACSETTNIPSLETDETIEALKTINDFESSQDLEVQSAVNSLDLIEPIIESDTNELQRAVESLYPTEYENTIQSEQMELKSEIENEQIEAESAVHTLQSVENVHSAEEPTELESAVKALQTFENVQPDIVTEVNNKVEQLPPEFAVEALQTLENVQPDIVTEVNKVEQATAESTVEALQTLENVQPDIVTEVNKIEQLPPESAIEAVQTFENIQPDIVSEEVNKVEPLPQESAVEAVQTFETIEPHTTTGINKVEQLPLESVIKTLQTFETVQQDTVTEVNKIEQLLAEPEINRQIVNEEEDTLGTVVKPIVESSSPVESIKEQSIAKSFLSSALEDQQIKNAVDSITFGNTNDYPLIRNIESSKPIPIIDNKIEKTVKELDEPKLNEPLVINVDDIERDKPYSPKIIIKPIREPEEEKASLKMTITKQSDTMHSSILKIYNPEIDSTTDQKLEEEPIPKLIIKNIPSPEQHSPKSTRSKVFSPSTSNQTRSSSPRITIKPIIKPEQERSISPLKISIRKEEKHSPKLTIKPIIKPIEDEKIHSPRVTIKPIPEPIDIPRITIKPIKPDEPSKIIIKSIQKNDIVDLTDITDNKPSPKITIKPVIKPDEIDDNDEEEEEEEERERIVLKINKGTIPISRKREHDDDREKLGKIKLKFSKEGGHPQIVQDDNEEGNFKKIKIDMENSKLREMLNASNNEQQNDNISLVEDLMNKNSPIVISEESNQSSCILIEDKESEQVFDMVQEKNEPPPPPPPPPPPSSSSDVTPTPPRKRGRPRKVPLVVREDFKDPKEEEKPIIEYSTRPKRSCRGQSVRTTLGIKPRKPRGPGRGRGGKRTVGDRETTPEVKPIKEPRSKRLKEISLIQKEYEENLLKTPILPPIQQSEPSSTPSAPPPIPPAAAAATTATTAPPSDIVMFEEETRMSAETSANTSRAQTPAKQMPTPVVIEVEESQSSILSTATTESTKEKRKSRMEIQEPEGAVISADQLAEYYWSGGGPYMLQEQVAQFLGIKSFKRKYPNIPRRTVDMQERDFIRESGLACESMCDLGLTAVNSADILDIMYSDFQDKYEEYCKHQRDRQAKDLINKQKALSLAASQEKNKYDITQAAVQSAAAWNATFNRARRDQRKACMDLQTLTIHYPKGKIKQKNKAKLGNYPVALVPGQFMDYYREFTPNELSSLPINTIVYGNINARLHEDMEVDSQTDGSGSESETSTSDSDSSFSGSSDGEDCTLCKTPTTTKKIAT